MQNEVPSISDEMIQSLERLNVSSPALQMFLRNLEILSGMKLNICSLLLILSALCISAGAKWKNPCNGKHRCPSLDNIKLIVQSTQSNGNGVEKDIFILGTDGFMGHIQKTGDCWNTLQIQYNNQCGSTSSAMRKLSNITVLSYEGDNETSSSDFGVFLSKDKPYKLNISRSIIPTFVCLIEGACKNYTWTKWIAEGCNWNLTSYFADTKCNMTCLNPTKACGAAKYDPRCSDDNAGDDSKMNTIEIDNKTATCFKCGSPFQNVEELKNIPPEISNLIKSTTKTETNAGAAVAVMEKLSSLVSLMENLTVVSISLGSIKGVLKKIQNESEAKESAFIPLETGIKVVEDFSELKNFPNAFTIPKEAILQAFNKNKSAGGSFLGVFRFPNLTKDGNNSTVLGDVYAIEMGRKVSNLTNNISLAFSNEKGMKGTPVCNSWDRNETKPNWTTDGCATVHDGNKITCNCSHLTFFAVLMSPVEEPISQNDLVTLTYITYIGCGLSMFFLGVALFIHFLLRKAKATNSAHVLINLFIALFLLNLAFLTNEYVARANSHNACKVMAGFMHFSLLASFSWFAVEALHLCLQMAKHSVVIKHYIFKISVLGWAPPAIVVSILFIFHKYGEQTIQTDSSNVTMCWILDTTIHYAVNIGYYCFVFIFTSCTCIVVLRWLSMLKMTKFNQAGKVKRSGTASFDITTILGLCCLLGLTWSFTFFSYGALRLPSYYIFTILNSFQGLFLFIYYVKTSTLFGDPVPSQESNMTEDTENTENTENPYEEDQPPIFTKKNF